MKYSNSYNAKKKRIRALPSLYSDMMTGALKMDAENLIKDFQNGIENNDFGLEALAPGTVEQKTRRGMKKPETPLLGRGDREKQKSYKNMLRIFKLKKGWKVSPSWGTHWTGKIKLRDLFTIHENGCKIVRGETIIQIPPRPAFLMSYRRMMSRKLNNQRETAREVKAAIRQYVNTGKIEVKMTGIGKKRSINEE